MCIVYNVTCLCQEHSYLFSEPMYVSYASIFVSVCVCSMNTGSVSSIRVRLAPQRGAPGPERRGRDQEASLLQERPVDVGQRPRE